VKVRFAVAPGFGSDEADDFLALVDGLEERGFDTIWMSDVPMAGTSWDPLLGLAVAAGRTRRLKLGANVVPIGRNPFRLAKELAQLDRLCHGRLLLSFVPGLDQPGERQALGIGAADRGRFMDEIVPLLRRWWDGEAVDHRSERFDFRGVVLSPGPVQHPLEIWMGGIGPKALERTGRLADGWLGAAVTPEEAGQARLRIEEAAAAAGRTADPEHFGLSLGYGHQEPSEAALALMRRRRPDADPRAFYPVGRAEVRDLIGRYVDNGISKFVLRPAEATASWDEELAWLADTVLDLQT
jgi:probable F420-dependent oxidoreductase